MTKQTKPTKVCKGSRQRRKTVEAETALELEPFSDWNVTAAWGSRGLLFRATGGHSVTVMSLAVILCLFKQQNDITMKKQMKRIKPREKCCHRSQRAPWGCRPALSDPWLGLLQAPACFLSCRPHGLSKSNWKRNRNSKNTKNTTLH